MVTIKPPKLTLNDTQHKVSTCNGQLPDYLLPQKVAKNLNQQLAYKRKVVVQGARSVQILSTQGLHAKFISGPAPESGDLQVVLEFVHIRAEESGSYLEITLTPEVGAASNTVLQLGHSNTEDSTGTFKEVASTSLDLAPDTVYEMEIVYRSVAGTVLYSNFCAYEVLVPSLNLEQSIVADPSQFLESPITDDTQYQLATKCNQQWSRGGPAVIAQALTSSEDAQSLTTTSGTWCNPFDQSTVQTNNTLGWSLALEYHQRKGQSGVRCQGYVYGTNISGTTFRLLEQASDTAVAYETETWYGDGTGWSEFTCLVPVNSGTLTKLDMQLKKPAALTPFLYTLYLQESDPIL